MSNAIDRIKDKLIDRGLGALAGGAADLVRHVGPAGLDRMVDDIEGVARDILDDPNADAAALDEALRHNPLMVAELQVEMARLAIEEERIHAGDRASARARHAKMGGVYPQILSTVIALGFFAILSFIVFRAVPAGMDNLFNIMLGTLAAAFIQVCNYWLGSSNGSKEKTQLMAGKG